MIYSKFIEDIKELEDNIDKDENEIDFTLLKTIQKILEQKEEKDREQQLLKKDIDEIINSIIDRPSDYFDTKERNIQKMIEKSRAKHAMPKLDKDREIVNNQITINTIVKLFDKAIEDSSSQEIKFQLADIRKEIKNINCRNQKIKVKEQIKKANIKAKLVLSKEIEKENAQEL